MPRENLATQVLKGLDAQVEAERDAGQLTLARDRIGVEVAKGGGWTVAIIDVSTLGAAPNGAPYPNDLHGYKFVYCRDGSTPGVLLDLDFGGGGRVQNVFPGNEFKGYFKHVDVRLSSQNLVTQGTVKLLVLRSPDVDYDELPPSAGAGQPSTGNASPAAGNGAETNVPTTSAQGLLLGGVSGARVYVGASDAGGAGVRTIATGSIHWWVRDPISGLWAESPVTEDLTRDIPRNVVVTSDVEFKVPFGRVFAELRDYSEDSGTANPAFVRLQTWGA